MKKNLKDKYQPENLVKLKKENNFPIKFPISFNNLNLGKITIDFEQNFEEQVPSKRNYEKMNLILHILDELREFVPFIKKDIEFSLKMMEKTRQPEDLLVFFLTYLSKKPKRKESLIKDKEIFDFLRSEGPISLCYSGIQMKMEEWLSDKDIFGRNMKLLFQSLKEYAYGKKILPVGRKKISMMKKIDPNEMKEMHRDITSILRIVKKNRKSYPSDNIYDPIERAGIEFLNDLERTWSNKGRGMDTIIFVKVVTYNWMYTVKDRDDKKYLSFISSCLENDEVLRTTFYSFNWEPNKLALEIISKLLDAKKETIRSKIHRQKNLS